MTIAPERAIAPIPPIEHAGPPSLLPSAVKEASDPACDRGWVGRGRCAGTDPDALFVQGKAQHEAKAVCRTCPVVQECLADALDNRTEFGVWGGMTERERRRLLRQHPQVTSWAELFAAARAGQN